MWNVFSSSGLATFLPRVALISVWLALSCITSAIHCNTEHQYTAAAAYSNGEVNIALSTLCVDLSMGAFHSTYPEKAPTTCMSTYPYILFKPPFSIVSLSKRSSKGRLHRTLRSPMDSSAPVPAPTCSQAMAMVLTMGGPALCTSLVFFLKVSTRCAMSVACCSWIFDNW